MTVGEPEISLNTWGLKYVIKKQDGSIQVAGGKVGGGEQPQQPSGTTPASTSVQHEDTSSSTDESKIDTTTSFGGGHATRHASVGDQGRW